MLFEYEMTDASELSSHVLSETTVASHLTSKLMMIIVMIISSHLRGFTLFQTRSILKVESRRNCSS
jgi:hypothetical protein